MQIGRLSRIDLVCSLSVGSLLFLCAVFVFHQWDSKVNVNQRLLIGYVVGSGTVVSKVEELAECVGR